MLNLLFEPVFNGSIIWTLVWAFQSKEKRAETNWATIDRLVTWALIFTSLLYLLSPLSDWVISYYSAAEYEQYVILNRTTGPYWIYYWPISLPYAVFPQLLWLKRLRNSKSFRIGLALCLLMTPIVGQLLTLIINLNRDYVPSSWAIFYPRSIEYIYSISIFALLIGAMRLCSIAYQRILRN